MNDSKRRKRRHDSDSSSASDGDEGKSRKTARKPSEISQQVAKERRKKKSRHESSSSSSDSERSDNSDQPRKKRKDAHKKDKARRKKEKRKRKREKKEKKNKRHKARDDEKAAVKRTDISTNANRTQVDISRKPVAADPEVFPKKRPMVPMTKEEYEKQQAQVRRVYDPETGRHRLIKGTGEILEEIVSKDRHKAINKTATQGDGTFFQANLGLKDK